MLAKPLQGPMRLFPDPAARAVVELHMWTMEAGLRGATAGDLFEGYCRKLVEYGIALLRGHVSTQTLHPQWTGYGYTWGRKLNAVWEQQFARVATPSSEWLQSPFFQLIERAHAGETVPTLRRRLALGPEQRDYPALEEFYQAGATDYLAALYTFGLRGDPDHGSGVVMSFTTDARDGFDDAELDLMDATLPGLALALKAHAGHQIAASLLGAYLGEDAGRRVHSGSVVRGVAESLEAVVWFADIRNFTGTSDSIDGAAVIELLDDMFEALAAALRPRRGQVLKFIGDAMLAIFAVDGEPPAVVCRRALDAAEDALARVAESNATRERLGLATAKVDIALHVGEVLYGNVGAADRLDFTVIGPAVNEASRIESLCDKLGRHLLASERFARAAELCGGRLAPLGMWELRGVTAPQQIYGLAEADTASGLLEPEALAESEAASGS